jgi:phospholipase/carboxylesterase
MKRGAHFLSCLLLACVLLPLGVRCESHAEAAGLAYVERVTGNVSADKKLPLLIAIHGLGDTPESFVTLFREFDVPARIIAPRAPDPWHGGFSWYPIDDATAKPAIIRERAEKVAQLIKSLSAEKPTRGRAVVTGFSQGGVLSFALAAYHPGDIAAAVPIAGMLEKGMTAAVPFKGPLPVIAFHGRADPRIHYADAERTVASLKTAGRKVTLSGYDGVGHGIPARMERDVFAALREQLAAAAGSTP